MYTPRKLLTAALAALLMCPVAARATECGDVDANGVVAASDALMVLRSAVGESTDMTCADAQTAGALEARVIALEDLLSHFTLEGNNLVLTGVNLQIVNGEGSTNTVNGVGNLILGYDEATVDSKSNSLDAKTGSHNLVIGEEHTYASFGAIVAGADNESDSPGASVLGGSSNTAIGANAVILAGSQNTADGDNAAIAGGLFNRTSAEGAFIGGGISNEARGFASSVTGGEFNRAISNRTSVTGGSRNAAYGQSSTVSGGSQNTAQGFASTVSGGSSRSIDGPGAWRGGGNFSAQ